MAVLWERRRSEGPRSARPFLSFLHFPGGRDWREWRKWKSERVRAQVRIARPDDADADISVALPRGHCCLSRLPLYALAVGRFSFM